MTEDGTTASSGLKNNATYNDLLAIWDAYNGAGTGTGSSGAPPNWANVVFGDKYWSATPGAGDPGVNDVTVALYSGYVSLSSGGWAMVASEVL
ncbi:MAG: hypothetical protein Q8M77_12340 [Hydrogenophaga sp.]|nr:hypothetical protein [Hydrogenophaga sp.]